MLADVIATVIYYIHFYAILTIYGQESTPRLWEPIAGFQCHAIQNRSK